MDLEPDRDNEEPRGPLLSPGTQEAFLRLLYSALLALLVFAVVFSISQVLR